MKKTNKNESQEVIKKMSSNDLMIIEINGITYGARFNNDGEIEIYFLNNLGEWEKFTTEEVDL